MRGSVQLVATPTTSKGSGMVLVLFQILPKLVALPQGVLVRV